MIKYRHFPADPSIEAEEVITLYINGDESVEQFKRLIQHGANLNPNISDEMKTLADLVTTGKQQQPYESTSG